MKRTLRTKIWCGVLAVACVSGVAFGAANLPHVQAEAVSGGVEVTEAPGNEAVVSEESKAEVPEISGNPEISEVSETAEVSSAKEEFESHFTADEKLDFSKIPKIVVVVKKSRHEKYLFLICFFKSRHEEYFCRSCFFKSGHGQ